MDFRTCSRGFIEEFINVYRVNECLWKVTSKDYFNKLIKEAAYAKLIELTLTVYPDANKANVIKKINNLRASYRKEKNKVRASMTSGSGTTEVYVPKLWYYSLLTFLDDSGQEAMPSTSSLNSTQTQDFSEILDDTEESQMTVGSNITASDTASVSSLLQETPMRASTSSRTSSSARKRCAENPEQTLLTSIRDKLNAGVFDTVHEDEYDAVGKNIAAKLRKIPENMKIIAEKLFADVIFAAQMGTLSPESVIYTPRPIEYTTVNNNSAQIASEYVTNFDPTE